MLEWISLGHDFSQSMVDSAWTFQGVMQEAHGQGQVMERIRHTLFNIEMEKLDGLDARFQKYDEIMQRVLAKTDRQGHEGSAYLGDSSMSKVTFVAL